MKISQKALVAFTTAMVSAQALAHSGHDHSSNTAMLSHVVFYGGIGAGLALIAFAGFKHFNKED